ncbi:MAG: cupin domain-containing protein [Pseudomonadota bacterium]
MRPGITANNRSEFYTEERCYITEISNHADDPHVSIARCRVTAGTTTQLHYLTVSERYLIESGSGIVELDGQVGDHVRPGDCVKIPAGCSQRIANPGTNDLIFLCVCSPRFTSDCYQDIEGPEVRPIELGSPPASP